MLHATKHTLIAILIAVILAPGFYMGVAPAQTVEAQSDIGMDDVLE